MGCSWTKNGPTGILCWIDLHFSMCLSIYRLVFHFKPSSYWGIHIYGNTHMPWFPNDLLTSAARSRCRFCRSSSASCTRRPWSRQRQGRKKRWRNDPEMIGKDGTNGTNMGKDGNMVEKDGKHMGKDAKWWEHNWQTWEQMGTYGNICVKLLCLILWKTRIYFVKKLKMPVDGQSERTWKAGMIVPW